MKNSSTSLNTFEYIRIYKDSDKELRKYILDQFRYSLSLSWGELIVFKNPFKKLGINYSLLLDLQPSTNLHFKFLDSLTKLKCRNKKLISRLEFVTELEGMVKEQYSLIKNLSNKNKLPNTQKLLQKSFISNDFLEPLKETNPLSKYLDDCESSIYEQFYSKGINNDIEWNRDEFHFLLNNSLKKPIGFKTQAGLVRTFIALPDCNKSIVLNFLTKNFRYNCQKEIDSESLRGEFNKPKYKRGVTRPE